MVWMTPLRCYSDGMQLNSYAYIVFFSGQPCQGSSGKTSRIDSARVLMLTGLGNTALIPCLLTSTSRVLGYAVGQDLCGQLHTGHTRHILVSDNQVDLLPLLS